MPDSRSALLAAAAEEFARHGPKGTRIQAIVQRAGVNERMIYHHFGSKDGLYHAVLEAQADGLVQAWRQVIDKATAMEPYEGMRTVLAGFADLFAARPLLVALTLHEALGGWRTLPLPTAEMVPFPELRALYERGQRQGVFRADCPFEIAPRRRHERAGRQRRAGAPRRRGSRGRRAGRRPGQAARPGRRAATGRHDRTTRPNRLTKPGRERPPRPNTPEEQ